MAVTLPRVLETKEGCEDPVEQAIISTCVLDSRRLVRIYEATLYMVVG